MRQPGILVLRAVAFLVIVLQHVLGAVFAMPGSPADGLGVVTFLILFSRFAVPAFIFASGYVSVAAVVRDGAVTFWGRRVRTVFVPYALWATAYFLVNGLTLGGAGRTYAALWSEWFWGLVRGDHSYHLWFMVMLVQLYFVLPALVWLLRRSNTVGLCTVAALIAFHVAWLSVGMQAASAAAVGTWAAPVFALSDRLLPPWLGWAGLGAAAAHFDVFRRSTQRAWLVGASAFVIVVLAVTVPAQYRAFIEASGDYSRAVSFSSLFAFRAAALCVGVSLLVIALGQYRPPASNGAFAAIDRISFVGYLVHPFMVSMSIELVVRHLAIQQRAAAFVATGVFAFALTLVASFALARAQRPVAEVLGAR